MGLLLQMLIDSLYLGLYFPLLIVLLVDMKASNELRFHWFLEPEAYLFQILDILYFLEVSHTLQGIELDKVNLMFMGMALGLAHCCYYY